MNSVFITDEMKRQAYFTFRNSHPRDNANYPIALEILKENGENDIPFSWEINSEVMTAAREINDILFKEFLTEYEYKVGKGYIKARKN